MKRICRLMLFGVFVLSMALPAGLAWAEEDYSQGMVDRTAAMAAADAVTGTKYPDADQVIVESMRRVRYQADGTYVQWEEVWLKILTEKGREDNTTLASSFTIPYQRGPEDCKVPLVEIVKPGGKVVTVDVAKNSEVMIDRSQMSSNIYNPNDKVIRVNVPGLAVGDTLHYMMYDRIVQPRIRDTFCDWLGFEGTEPHRARRRRDSGPQVASARQHRPQGPGRQDRQRLSSPSRRTVSSPTAGRRATSRGCSPSPICRRPIPSPSECS